MPVSETCNNMDDDCDGKKDEGNPEAGGVSCGDPDGECGKTPGVLVCKHYPAGAKPDALDCGTRAFDLQSATCVGCHADTHFAPHQFDAAHHARTALPLDGNPLPYLKAAAALGFPAVEFWPYEGKNIDAEVTVVGSGNPAGQGAIYLAGVAKKVYVIFRRKSLRETMSEYLVKRLEEHPNIEIIGSTAPADFAAAFQPACAIAASSRAMRAMDIRSEAATASRSGAVLLDRSAVGAGELTPDSLGRTLPECELEFIRKSLS